MLLCHHGNLFTSDRFCLNPSHLLKSIYVIICFSMFPIIP